MKKTILIATAAIALMMTSCASIEKTSPIMSLKGNTINTYVAADLDYANAKKVEATVNYETILGIATIHNGKKTLSSSNRYRGLKKEEQQALYRAKELSGKDIILDPQFEIEKHSWFFGAHKTKTVKVTGWGVDIKGLKDDPHAVLNSEK
ncbi:MAG: hypothetical protein LUC88_08950 [Prevotella sp.]|nr:hypothetical protein [Prevotella sp.]